MAYYIPLTVSLTSLPHDALTAAGASAALLARRVSVNLAIPLTGLLGSPGGRRRDLGGQSIKCGSVAAPIVSEPETRRTASPEPTRDSFAVGQPVQPVLWKHLAGSGVIRPASPLDGARR
jgi:hypothetical protein